MKNNWTTPQCVSTADLLQSQLTAHNVECWLEIETKKVGSMAQVQHSCLSPKLSRVRILWLLVKIEPIDVNKKMGKIRKITMVSLALLVSLSQTGGDRSMTWHLQQNEIAKIRTWGTTKVRTHRSTACAHVKLFFGLVPLTTQLLTPCLKLEMFVETERFFYAVNFSGRIRTRDNLFLERKWLAGQGPSFRKQVATGPRSAAWFLK